MDKIKEINKEIDRISQIIMQFVDIKTYTKKELEKYKKERLVQMVLSKTCGLIIQQKRLIEKHYRIKRLLQELRKVYIERDSLNKYHNNFKNLSYKDVKNEMSKL